MISILCTYFIFFVALVECLPKTSNNKIAPGVFVKLHKFDESIFGEILPQNLLKLDINELNQLDAASRRQKVFDFYHNRHQLMAAEVKEDLVTDYGVSADKIESLWSINSLFIRDWPEETTMLGEAKLRLQSHPHVMDIETNDVIADLLLPVEDPEPVEYHTISNDNITWSVRKVGADKVWEELGVTGKGVRVGIIDTGVEWMHPSIRRNYVGSSGKHDYAWFDPKEFARDPWWCPDFTETQNFNNETCFPKECCLNEPFDIIGHGTHCQGTISGSAEETNFAIGVAPGSEWIAAKGCRDGQCLKYGLVKSAEWIVCPTDLKGKNPRCDLGADVVSNSWGSQDPEERIFVEVVRVWREAGMIPVFANGNLGPNCGSLSAPGDFANVIGIGATTANDQLTKFSSRGPGPADSGNDGVFGLLKPDFCAPGYKVISASAQRSNKPTLFESMSGTSMATPHVTGVIALMISAHRKARSEFLTQAGDIMQDASKPAELSYDQIYSTLAKTSVRNVLDPIGGGGRWLPFPWIPIRKECNGTGYKDWPNTFYGYGRVDAFSAVRETLKKFY